MEYFTLRVFFAVPYAARRHVKATCRTVLAIAAQPDEFFPVRMISPGGRCRRDRTGGTLCLRTTFEFLAIQNRRREILAPHARFPSDTCCTQAKGLFYCSHC